MAKYLGDGDELVISIIPKESMVFFNQFFLPIEEKVGQLCVLRVSSAAGGEIRLFLSELLSCCHDIIHRYSVKMKDRF